MAARLTTYLVVAIVATTFIAGLIVGAQRDDSDGPVDLIVHNATVYTADRGTIAEAVAIRGNQILRVGSNREIARFERPQTVMIDARGGAVLPGFNDSQLNLISGGLGLSALDLSITQSAEELLARVAAWSASNPSAAWIVGRGLSPEHFKNRQPSRTLLDSIVKDRPVLLYGPDETAWVNSQALRLGQITRTTADPENGAIVRESRKGEPTGVLSGSAVGLVEKLVPPPSRDERLAAIRAAIAEANRLGITSIQTTAESIEDLEIYDGLRRAGGLTLRIYSGLRLNEPLTDSNVQQLAPILAKYPDDPLFKIGALSIRVDGDIASRTAAMLVPYEDASEAGELTFTADELNRTARLADSAGWQIVANATGDRAVRTALTAIAHAVRSNRPPARGRRHRIANLALVDGIDVPRFGPLGVAASMQPARSLPSPDRIELLTSHLGEERANSTFAFATIAEQTHMLFGSAWPTAPLDPLIGLHAAVNQTTLEGLPEGGWHPNERLRLEGAVDAYTRAGAWASFDDQRKGTISAGMLADLVVLSHDIFDLPAARLTSASVAATIFDGKVVYRRVPRSETEPVPSLQH
jgi:predicted amidohydrolase YtcJ